MTDEQAIKQTVTDYFESWFEGDAPRMERALHPRLANGDRPATASSTRTRHRR
jgi:uncharacterized protein YhfF